MTGERLIKVAQVADVPPGTAIVVRAEGRALALFNVDGRFYALDNACPHRGGPLGEGDIAGTVVTCPWHAWSWDVTSGANVNNPAVRVTCHVVTVNDGSVLVSVGTGGSAAG